MANKIFTGFVVAFWAVMMTALVRVEFFPAPSRLRSVPMEQVMRRVFAVTDTQRLYVWHDGKRIGWCEFTVSPRPALDAPEITPVPERPGAYFVQANMRLKLQVLGVPSVFRLNVDSWFDRRFELRGPYNLQTEVGGSRVVVRGDNDTKKVALKYDLGEGEQSKQFDYAQLKDPAALQSLGLPTLPGVGLPTASTALPVTHAYDDRLEFGGVRQHAFLIECKGDRNSGLWAKAWVDDAGNVMLIETSWGLTMRSGLLDSFATQEPTAKPLSATRRLQ